MNKNLNKKIQILILIAILLVSTGFRCKWQSPKEREALKPIELTYWRVYDDQDAFSDIIATYQAVHPNITINYRKLRYEEYEKALLEAWAEDRGPDIFSVRNTWLGGYQTKIEPMPEEITMAYQVVKKSLGVKEEVIIELRTTPTLSLRELKDNFLDVVANDVIFEQKIYGLPLAVDSLVMFYNRDLLDNAGIALPPANWREFQQTIKKLTYQDRTGKIIQAGAALGTSENVGRASDILSLLMMQNGAQMARGSSITFQSPSPTSPDRDYLPGAEALRFYTDFASPTKEVYTWNSSMPDSLEAFLQGKAATFFGYSYHIPYIENSRRGKLNYGLAKMPQIEGNPEINFANYWVETVSKKSQHVNEAWDFILFASKAEQVTKYLDKARKPTALRSLIDQQLQDDQLNVFASQLLTSQSWYRGKDAQATEVIFADMIDSVVENNVLPKEAVELAASRVQQTMR